MKPLSSSKLVALFVFIIIIDKASQQSVSTSKSTTTSKSRTTTKSTSTSSQKVNARQIVNHVLAQLAKYVMTDTALKVENVKDAQTQNAEVARLRLPFVQNANLEMVHLKKEAQPYQRVRLIKYAILA